MLLNKDVYNAKIKDIENKILDINNLATNTTLNTKINETKNEIPSAISLVTNTFLNVKIHEVENDIPVLLTQLLLLPLLLLRVKYLTIVNTSLLQNSRI